MGLGGEPAREGEVEMEAFVGDDKSVGVIPRLLHLLLCAAPWVCASVVTPACFQPGTLIRKKKMLKDDLISIERVLGFGF